MPEKFAFIFKLKNLFILYGSAFCHRIYIYIKVLQNEALKKLLIITSKICGHLTLLLCILFKILLGLIIQISRRYCINNCSYIIHIIFNLYGAAFCHRIYI